jgi:hypothetical protein
LSKQAAWFFSKSDRLSVVMMKCFTIFGFVLLTVFSSFSTAQAYDCKDSLEAAGVAIAEAKSALAVMAPDTNRSRVISYIVDAELLLHRAHHKFKTAEHRRQDQDAVIAKAASAEELALTAHKLAQQ